jgi:dihydrofolate synthase / folylpolyglutamate synthase
MSEPLDPRREDPREQDPREQDPRQQDPRQEAVDDVLAEVRAAADATSDEPLVHEDDPQDLDRLRRVHGELLARAPEHRIAPRLDAVRDVCALLGDPQRAYRVVHVAGTNGKTSTARAVERLLGAHDLRTGRFTSPHLTSPVERISIDGLPLTAAGFTAAYEDVAPYLEMVDGRLRQAGQPPVTYFEALTVMAFAAFADAPVDVAVLEVGLGGTWDATNVADAEVAVVTPISLDHTDLLGGTLAAIAGEKAGVLKPGATAVLAQQPDDAAAVLLERARAVGASVVREGVDVDLLERQVAVGGQNLTLQGMAGVYADVLLPLHGLHQAHNALLALVAAEALLTGGSRALDGDVVGTAFAGLTAPGRLEVVRTSPTVLVDAAHNVAGAAALADALEEEFAFRTLVGVVGVLEGKDAEGILSLLEPVLDAVVVTRSGSPRAIEPDDLGVVAERVFGPDRVHVVERLDDAIATAVDLAEAEEPGRPGSGVVVTGSVTVAGEARVLLRAAPAT